MAKRILGMGDVISLIETASQIRAEEIEQEEAERMMRADLNLNDFLTINKQVRKIGGIQKLVSALPGGDKALKDGQVNENALVRWRSSSIQMTKEEREKPSVLNGSRRARVASGAGVSAHAGQSDDEEVTTRPAR